MQQHTLKLFISRVIKFISVIYNCTERRETFFVLARYCHIQSILNNISSTLRHMPNNIDASLGVKILEK